MFASRDRQWLEKASEYEAVNVLTHINRLDKFAPGARSHYDSLSERCHPNMMGHHFMFTETDHSDGTVRFKDERHPDGNQLLILGGIMLVGLIVSEMARLDGLITEVADLQHRLNPVPSSNG